MTIEDNGQATTFGDIASDGPHVKITIYSSDFWIRLALVQDLGFAEAYMAGEVQVSDLVKFISFYIKNREVIDKSCVSPAVGSLMYLANTRFGNSVINSINNVSAHYDLGNEMFEMFLDSSMTYSCAIWNGPNDTLEAAQLRKLDMLIDKACLKPTDYVLDLGCGWGSLAMRAVERTGCRVLGITLSTEQKEIAERRIAQAGMSDNIEIMLIDYRKLDPNAYCFDKIISIEMIEQVGYEYLPVYFEQCHRLLHPQHGLFAIQMIAMNEERYEKYKHSVDFINKHIFPGGHCPSISATIAAATRSSHGKLMVENITNYPDHYAHTLRVWRERFLNKYQEIQEKTVPKNPQLLCQEQGLLVNSRLSRTNNKAGFGFDDVFRRKWEYYFAYCEAAFATRAIASVQLVFSRTYNDCLSSLSFAN
ncbi:hypothetical protein IWW36_001125 [Coemansia brasiliensis]|uniref:Cyclopropane-fatty-acyl-phospholipid synthase n=1 Tax=Coemansia brasiliensis TaxID=2650707 RepID=A0A9W8IFY7_9FUNG|nr:hypothetical protein IWW36_001125 [Coemansia brasiliensis]